MTKNKILRIRYKLKINNRRNLPRLSVYKSAQHTEAQIIDDSKSHTVASASTKQKMFREKGDSSRNKNAASWVGAQIANHAKKAGITEMIFDRGGRRYHKTGCLDVLVSAVREQGIKI